MHLLSALRTHIGIVEVRQPAVVIIKLVSSSQSAYKIVSLDIYLHVNCIEPDSVDDRANICIWEWALWSSSDIVP